VVDNIRPSIDPRIASRFHEMSAEEREQFVNDVSLKHTKRSVHLLMEESSTIRSLVDAGKVGIAGAMYDLVNSSITFCSDCVVGFELPELPATPKLLDRRPQSTVAETADAT
jgi:carbonic anhydrase